MFFLLLVNDPFILNKSGSLCFLLFLFRILFIVDHVCLILFLIIVKTGMVILFFRCMNASFQNIIKSFKVSCSRLKIFDSGEVFLSSLYISFLVIIDPIMPFVIYLTACASVC